MKNFNPKNLAAAGMLLLSAMSGWALSSPVSIGTLPPGKSVRVIWQATIANPLPVGVGTVTNEGIISGGNFSSVLTDDPDTGAVNDATVTLVSVPPVVSTFSKTNAEDTTLTFAAADFTSHYSDPNSDALASVKITSLPANGTLSSNGVAVGLNQVIAASGLGSLTYLANTNYNGADSFSWNANDGTFDALSDATVNLVFTEVNDPPTATNDVLGNINQNAPTQTNSFALLLANDSPGPANESGQTLTIIGVSAFVGGTASLSGANVLFTPTPGYSGSAGYVYTNQDNGTTAGVNDFKTSTATVSFTILNAPEIGVQQPLGTDLADGTGSIDFGNIAQGSSSAVKTFTITNSGGLNLTGLAITKDGANAGDFTVSALGSGTLTPGTSETFTVIFSPSATGARTAAIHIASNDADENPFDIALTGTGHPVPVHYSVVLDGPSESPPNASPATGTADFYYDSTAHTLQVSMSFSGLLGTTTASHVHSATVTAGIGTAGVATTTPTFAGFPLGVTSGTYNNTLDLTQASSYNPAYVTANGGTTATAEAALAAGMAAGKAYLNIHSTVFPGGEIRGFLIAAPSPEIGVQQPLGTDLVDGASSIDFGRVATNLLGSARVFTITNSGGANLNGLAIAVNGANAGDFTVSGISTNVLAPGTSTTFTVTFAPTAVGARNAAIHIASNDGDENTFDIALIGTGLPAVNAYDNTTTAYYTDYEEANANGLVLGDALTLVQGGPLGAVTLSLANRGGGPLLKGTMLVKIYDNTVPYASGPLTNVLLGTATLNWDYTSVGGMPVDDYEIQTFDVGGQKITVPQNILITQQFTETAGTRTNIGAVFLGDPTIGSSPTNFYLKSSSSTEKLYHFPTGVSGQLACQVVLTGTWIATQPANVATNLGADAHFHVVVSSVTPLTYQWRKGGVNLSNGGNISGATTDTLTVQSIGNADLDTYSVVVTDSLGSLTSNGATLATQSPEIGVQQPLGTDLTDGVSINFGNVPNGSNGVAMIFTITNSGTSDLTLGAFAVDGANPGDFIVSAPGTNTVATNTSTTFAITFAPGALGARSAALHIANNDSDENPFDISLTGNGAVPAVYALGRTSFLEGPTAGSDSVTLVVTPEVGVWTPVPNVPWLHAASGFQTGSGSTNVVFTFDANSGTTRTGTMTIAGGLMITVMQAGSTYSPATAVGALVAAGLSSPTGIGTDSAGNVYFADTGHNAIKKWTLSNNTVTTLVSNGLSSPYGLAVDGAGNVFFADAGHNAIKEWLAADGSVNTVVAAGLSLPRGLALDGAGNLYIADSGTSSIKKWTAANSTLTTLVSGGLALPYGVAVDGAGNVYIADTSHNSIKKWSAANSLVSTLVSTGLSSPKALAVDGAGNVYIADSSHNVIKELVAVSGSVVTVVGAGLHIPSGVTVDGAGNIFIADTFNGAIKELPHAFVDATAKSEGPAAGSDSLAVVVPATADLLAPFNPTSDQSWLTIDGAVGGVVNFSFTANPVVASRTANITVLGQLIAVTQGSRVFGNSDLTNLTLSVGSLSPVFDANLTNYTVTVPGATTSLTVTPTQVNANATTTVNNTSVASGVASGGINLGSSHAVITIVVTAQGGNPTKTYTITVNRAPIAADECNGTITGVPATNAIADLLASANDLDGDAVSLVSVSATSANGASVVVSGTNIVYTPVGGFQGADVFTYTITDNQGGSASATVTVNVLAANLPLFNRLAVMSVTDQPSLQFIGLPCHNYVLLRADNVSGPYLPLTTNTAPANGLIQYLDVIPRATNRVFYRMRTE